jgi:AbrB family looped-hinge helix DNA binding protein
MMVVTTTSKITSKGQTTLPKEIRDKLGVRSGDTLIYEVEGNAVRVRKAEPFDLAWHRAISSTLAEWDSTNDHENFDDL